MAFDLLQTALDFLAEYGLLAVFVLLVLDGALLLPVLPGEVIMIMAVTQYARSPADLVGLILVATAAAMVGSLMLYGAARAGGRRLVERHPRLFLMSRKRREKLERSFQNPLGQSLVLFLRLIPFTRVLVNIPAGVAKMPLLRFVVLSGIGMAVFHAAFMWFAYEVRRPGSGVGIRAAALQDAYASPAWDFMVTNKIVTGLGILALGAYLSLRSSKQMLREPDEAGRSLLGFLSARVLLWGGIALGGAVWLAPERLYEASATGGLDIEALAATLKEAPQDLVVWVSAAAMVLGTALVFLERGARRRVKRVEAQARLEKARREAKDAAVAAGGPAGTTPRPPPR